MKARLVARGFQDPAVKAGSLGVGACMAARLSSLHVLFTAAQRKWEVVKIDISGAFLKGEKLKRDVFLVPPPEARCPAGSVWKANMAVYGLVDAPFEFYRSLDRFLRFHEVWEEQLQWVITQCEEDPCVYVVHDIHSVREAPVMVFATHVDDFLVCGPSEHIRNFHACVLSSLKRLSKPCRFNTAGRACRARRKAWW